MKVFWTKNPEHGKEPPDLSEDPEYSQRLQYLGDKQKNCTIRLSNVTQKDENEYCFRFITDKLGDKWLGHPGVYLTVTGRKLLYAAGGVTGGLGGLISIFIIVWLMRKKQRPNHIAQKQDDLYVNVSAHNGSLSESDAANQNDALYSLITLSNFSHNQTEGKASDSEDTEEVQYVSVLYHRNNEMNQPEENESQYDNIRKYQTDAARRSTDQMVEDQSVIYSTVK
ncbi:hypothetical protein cypCar_00009969 [Cyprinus carpio]|nr:hypothetical protein cypCar_00009969 [Cyprinus carpio]